MRGLAFFDAHVSPGQDYLERFDHLSKYISDTLPDYIVQGGDFITLDSVSSYQREDILARAEMDLREEIEVFTTAVEDFFHWIIGERYLRRAAKRKQYQPKIYWFYGNHEDRWRRYCIDKPELRKILNLDEIILKYANGLDVEIVPYPEYRVVENVYYMHAPVIWQNRPISARKAVGWRALPHYDGHIIFGHYHWLEIASMGVHGNHIPKIAVCAGTFSPTKEDYMRHAPYNWWPGFIEIEHLDTGAINIRLISLNDLKELAYGRKAA